MKVYEESVLEKLIREERWKRLEAEMKEPLEQENESAEALGVTHQPGCAVPDTGCAKSLIGLETLNRHEQAMGRKVSWVKDAKRQRFRGFDDSLQESMGAVELPWRLKNKIITFIVHVVPGNSGLLLSRPDLKSLGARMDLARDELYLKELDETVPMMETPAGHYEIDLLGRGDAVKAKPAFPSTVRIAEVDAVTDDGGGAHVAVAADWACRSPCRDPEPNTMSKEGSTVLMSFQ